jgi:hypothetical protein
MIFSLKICQLLIITKKTTSPLYNFQAIFFVAQFRILKEKNAYAFSWLAIYSQKENFKIKSAKMKKIRDFQ